MKQGDRATCATCGQPIDYIGSAWRHTGGQRTNHPAVPVEDEMLRPADVIGMGLKEFARRFGFKPADALEKWWFAMTQKRLDAAQRREFESGLLAWPGDLSGVVMED